MHADDIIREVFDEYGTQVLNVADFGITTGIDTVTHAVLDGDRVLAYMADPDLGEDFQDGEYELVPIEDDPEAEDQLYDAIRSLI